MTILEFKLVVHAVRQIIIIRRSFEVNLRTGEIMFTGLQETGPLLEGPLLDEETHERHALRGTPAVPAVLATGASRNHLRRRIEGARRIPVDGDIEAPEPFDDI